MLNSAVIHYISAIWCKVYIISKCLIYQIKFKKEIKPIHEFSPNPSDQGILISFSQWHDVPAYTGCSYNRKYTECLHSTAYTVCVHSTGSTACLYTVYYGTFCHFQSGLRLTCRCWTMKSASITMTTKTFQKTN